MPSNLHYFPMAELFCSGSGLGSIRVIFFAVLAGFKLFSSWASVVLTLTLHFIVLAKGFGLVDCFEVSIEDRLTKIGFLL